MKGAKHMLTSYDHLLFLLGVVFYLSKISEIISFNLGVELGQILALIPMVYTIKFLRQHRHYPAFYKAVNSYFLLAGLLLVIYQIVLYLA